MTALDRTDLELLALLENDARTTHKELAAAVGLAPSSCHARLARLRESGVLGRATSEIDMRAVGFPLEALIFVQLERHSTDTFDAMLERLLGLDEVLELYHVAGSIDVIARVAARNVEHLRELVVDHVSSLQEVRHLETSLVFVHHRRAGVAQAALRARS